MASSLGRQWHTENTEDVDYSQHCVQQERVDMYITSGPESDFRSLGSASEYTTPRAASLTDNHEIIGNDADM